MAQVINTNIASLNSQRNLNRTQSQLGIALQRLSSGLRINSAKDDAAGLAISERFTTQIRGLNQAVRNANDAISLSQTAEGALGEYGNILQRIRELAIQSANSTNSASDRAALNSEAQDLLSELQRVATTTQFNGQNIIDGTFTGAQFQVGANANQTILVNVGNAQTSALGSYQVGSTAQAVSGSALAGGDLLLNGIDVGASVSGTAEDIAAAINAVTSKTGVKASASTVQTSENALLRNQTLQSGDLLINGVNVGAVAGSNNLATQGANIAAAINNVSSQTGVTATADLATGALTLKSSTGKDIVITSSGNAGAARVENATGFEVSSSQTVASLEYAFAAGTRGTNQLTFDKGGSDTNPGDGETFTLQGKTFEFDSGGGVASGNIAIAIVSGSLTGTIDNAVTVVNNNTSNITASNSGGTALLLTSNVITSTNTHTDITATSGTNVQETAGTTGVGLAVGDTLTVGGVTYEFLFDDGTVSNSSYVKVSLGAGSSSDNTTIATNFNTAINAQYTAGNTNVQSTVASNVVTVTSDLKGASGTSSVTDSSLPSAGVVTQNASGGSDGTYAANTTRGTIELNSSKQILITGANTAKAGLQSASATLNAISTVDISTVSGANTAISLVDGALDQVNSIRGDLGAVQNRFESTIANLTATSENLSAARSRILDADYAQETAALTRAQILQQAGVSILSQANSLPQLVLSLLQ